MTNINYKMLTFAILVVTCFILTGVSIAEQSVIGIILSLVAAVVLTGFGFITKKKLRESGKL